jgi:hypothetical protein
MKKNPPSTGKPSRRISFGWLGWMFIAAMLSCGALVLPLSTLLKTQEANQGWVPFNLHSVLNADYSAEASGYRVPAIGIGLIAEVMRDQSNLDIERRMTEIERRLEQPVPSVTPRFPGSGQPTALPATPTVAPPSPTASKLATRTPPPTASPSPIPTEQPSATPIQILPSPTDRPWYPSPTARPIKPKPTDTPPTASPPTESPRPTDPPPPPPPADPPYPGPDPNPEPPTNPYP